MKVAIVSLALLAGAATVAAQPANIRHAQIRTRDVAAGRLAAEVRDLSANGPVWIGWTAPLAERRTVICCFGSGENWTSRGGACCGRCALEEHGAFFRNANPDPPVALEPPDRFVVLVRGERGRLQRVRTFSLGCEIDAGGLPVAWLNAVAPAEGIALLESLATPAARRPRTTSAAKTEDVDDDEEEPEGSSDPAISAIALHAAPEADAALERLLDRSRPLAIRKKAAFWLGNSRGQRGLDVLRRIVPVDPDPRFRKEATFAVSQSRAPDAVKTLVGMARRDSDSEVRGQALFWLAQKAGRKAAEAIEGSIRDDPDTEVKKHAVFALAQIPDGEGVPELIRVARTNRNPEVRKQAIFWLGQSNDERAVAFLEEVLTK